MDAFAKLGASETVPIYVKKSLNRYTCTLYGVRGKCQDVNHARHTLLLKKVPKRKAKQSLSKLKSFDPATLPPCLSVLEQKISRVNLVTHIWANAHKLQINEWDPLKHGWVKEEKTGNLIPSWFEGERVPDDLLYEEMEEDDMSDSDNDEENSDNDDSDSSSSSERYVSSECDDSDNE